MANLLVGDVSATTARVWVRGDKKKKRAELSYRTKGKGQWKTLTADLLQNRGYINVFDISALSPATLYEIDLVFKPANSGSPLIGSGAFATAPRAPRGISFLLGSCNWTRAPLDILDPEEAWTGIELLAKSLTPDFMIHCGDQIYSDVVSRPLAEFLTVDYYREQYKKSWSIKPTARVLASMPHYMVLDDHEIFDDFYNGKPLIDAPDTATVAGNALAAYREFQHCHNPQPYNGYYFSFNYAGVAFFFMDVRTERYRQDPPRGQIMSAQQMKIFKDWLKSNANAVKFVVTSVPFVAEKRKPDDKWNDRWNADQRNQVINHLAVNPDIDRLIFLTGDMHCSYHATMKIQRADGTQVVVHELMSSPINQFCSKLHAFQEHVDGNTSAASYVVDLKESEFYGDHSNVMHISAALDGTVSWNVYRTKGVVAPPKQALPVPPSPFKV